MKFTKALLLACAVLLVLPASAFALLDVGVYGGYSFAGEIETDTDSPKTSGPEFGAFAHYNTGLPLLLTLGVGPFYQKTYLSYDLMNNEYDATRSMVGLDVYLQVELPNIIHPYIRGGSRSRNGCELDGREASTKSEYFKSYYGGLALH